MLKRLAIFLAGFVLILRCQAATNTTWTTLGISEFMATNASTITDVDGDYSPWIELYNASSNTVNLAGWSLTTNLNNVGQWKFPNITILAGDYVVIFASGKNRTNNTAELHTNFRLPVDGGYLALIGPFGTVQSSFPYPQQSVDVSYGADGATPNLVGYFLKPSPDDENIFTGTNTSSPVTFSQAGGTFTSEFFLSLSATNGSIYYTTDGTYPTQESTLYQSPIPITQCLQIRARAFANGLNPGPIHSETYLQLNNNLVHTNSNLPAIVLYNFAAGVVPTNTYQFVNASIYEPVNGVTSLTNAPTLNVRGGIHLHGSSTINFAKKSFTMDFWDELNGDADNSPLGLPADSNFILYATDYYEPILTHNPLMYQISNDIGRYASRTRYCEVYISTNGGALDASNYNGIYVLEEKIKWGANRVNVAKLRSVDELHPLDNTSNVSGGFIAAVDRLDTGETGFVTDSTTNAYEYPKDDDINTPQRLPQKQYLQSYMDNFASVLNSANYTNLTNGYRQFIDVPSWVDHHILNAVAFNVDMIYYSSYYHKDRNGLIVYGPIWDFDRSQGSRDLYDFNPNTWGQTPTAIFQNAWWTRLFTDVDFWQAWIDEYEYLRLGALSTNHIFATLDDLTAQVRAQEPREVARWPLYSTPRSNTLFAFNYTNTFPGTYQGEIDFEKRWFTDRLHFIDTNFLSLPSITHGTGYFVQGDTASISSTNANGKIYYTTNGTDPRLPGGVVSSNALLFSSASPIALYSNLTVVARVYDTTHHNLTGSNNPPANSFWSGSNVVVFLPGSRPVISSISQSLDAYLGQSPMFNVVASGFPAPLYQWYLNDVPLNQQTNASLSLTLIDTNQAGVYSVMLSNAVGTVTGSLTLNITSKPNLVITEVMSSESKGSVNSTLDHEDWWELSNFGNFPVNLQGFRFDDDHDSFADAQTITNAVKIQPGESIVLVEEMSAAAFQNWWGTSNLPPSLQIITYPSIGFSSDDDAIYLWNAAATNVSDVITSVTFGSATKGVSFGYNFDSREFGGLSSVGQFGAYPAAVNGDIGSPGLLVSVPRVTESRLTTDGHLTLSFTTELNRRYEVQYKQTLTDQIWLTLSDIIANSTTSEFTDTSSATNQSRFYRIVVIP